MSIINQSDYDWHLLEDKDESDAVSQYEPILWMNILISLGAYQMYRQHMQSRVTASDVVAYLLTDKDLPRAIMHCLNQIKECLSKLPNGNKLAKSIDGIDHKIKSKNAVKLIESGLHEFVDELQIDLANINNKIEAKWFLN